MQSYADKIKDLCMYKDGREFSRAEVLSGLHMDTSKTNKHNISSALKALVERGELRQTSEGKYHRPIRHWIHTRRLANPVEHV